PKSTQEIEIEKYVGSYENQSIQTKLLSKKVKRFHIHSKGYFIIEDLDGNFYDYKFTFIENSIYLLNEKIEIKINQFENIMSWEEKSQLKVIKLKKINPNSIPLLKDNFHW